MQYLNATVDFGQLNAGKPYPMLKPTEPLVRLENAGLSRDGRWLVREVSLNVNPGEIVTLIGPNGSGKSTTAKMALGVLRADEGSVSRRADLRVGYVPQKLSIDRTLPLLVHRFMDMTSPVSKQEALAAMAATGVEHLADKEVRHLSGGEFQRVLLARAMVRKPDLLVLDEPVQGVDFAGEIALYDLIRQIRDDNNCGILLISHDLHVVMAATDQVICLNGHVCCSGTPTAVASSAEYKALFGARAATTLAVYEHNHDHTHLPDGRVRHRDRASAEHCPPGDGHQHQPKPPYGERDMGNLDAG